MILSDDDVNKTETANKVGKAMQAKKDEFPVAGVPQSTATVVSPDSFDSDASPMAAAAAMEGDAKGHRKKLSRSDRYAVFTAGISPATKVKGAQHPMKQEAMTAPVVPTLVQGEVFKRNYSFGYKKRWLIIDMEGGSFSYYTSNPLLGVRAEEVQEALRDWKEFPSGAVCKLRLQPGHWSLCNAADDDGGFFIFKGGSDAANTKLSSKMKDSSLFFKVIKLDSGIRTAKRLDAIHDKRKYVAAAVKLSARGADQWMNRYNIKGIVGSPNQNKRQRKQPAARQPDVLTRSISDLTAESGDFSVAASSLSSRSVKSFGPSSSSVWEHRVKPARYYPNTWMTDAELMAEVVKPSEQLVDTSARSGLGGPVIEQLGLVQVELLAAFGLPKLDRIGKTDFYANMIVGPNVFRTDTIDDNYSPVFLPKCKRGAIFPLFVPYEQLYVGGFDDDGDYLTDDFAGRVQVDLSRLEPHKSYDVTLKMRESDTIYSRRPRGSIRLRIKIIDYSPPFKIYSSLLANFTSRPETARGIICNDKTSAKNMSLILWGTEIPGEYTPTLFKATLRESDLYEINFIYTVKKTLHQLRYYENGGLFGNLKSLYALAVTFWIIDEGARAALLSYLVFLLIVLVENFHSRNTQPFSNPVSTNGDDESQPCNAKRVNTEFPFCNNDSFPFMDFDDCLARKMKSEGLMSLIEESLNIDVDKEDENIADDDDPDNDDFMSLATQYGNVVSSHLSDDKNSTFNKSPKYIEQEASRVGNKTSIVVKFAKYEKRARFASGGLVHDVVLTNDDGTTEPAIGGSGNSDKKEKGSKKFKLRSSPVNPVIKLKMVYLGPVQRGFKNVVNSCRSLYNIVTWRSVPVSSVIFAGLVLLTIVCYFFPFSFFAKLGAVAAFGPQNYVLSRRKYKKIMEDAAAASENPASPDDPSPRAKDMGPTKRKLFSNPFSRKAPAPQAAQSKKGSVFLHIPRRNAFDTSRFRDDANLLVAT